jgi:transcriptional regulator with XRE-family HTH domain
MPKRKPLITFAGQIGQRLRRAREACGLSGAALAGRLGVSPQRYNNYETGDIVLPPDIAVAIFQLLRIGPEYLYLGQHVLLPAEIREALESSESPPRSNPRAASREG